MPLLQHTLLCACGVTAGLLSLALSDAQRTVLDDVLERAGRYVVRYERDCSAVVAEEHYVQDLQRGCRKAGGGVAAEPLFRESPPRVERTSPGATHRELVSDVLMVQMPDQTWAGFRDVAVVDGHAVRDRGERLESLFLKSKATLRKVQEESARYNIGDIRPQFNLPTFALAYLHPDLRHRFAFVQEADEVVDAVKAVVVAFAEVERPSVIVDDRGHDIPSTGRFWINPATGEVIKSLLVAGTHASAARIESVVAYRRHQEWNLLLPYRMDETYDRPGRPGDLCVVGSATYSNFRRFQVSVDEKVKPPK